MPAPTLLAHDRSGPTGSDAPLVLIHAGVADRRMWQPQWAALTRDHDVVRLDLRGFGESSAAPADGWSHREDVAATLAALGIDRAHLVGCSLGAGVAVEVALTVPGLAASLLLVTPGGALITEATDELRECWRAEGEALGAGNLDAAAAANVDWWLAGPHRAAGTVDADSARLVHTMQRRAFEIGADWDGVDEAELDPSAADRLGEISAPTLVLAGALDIDAVGVAAAGVVLGVPGARLVTWADTAHLPSLERPDDFVTLLEEWLASLA